MRVYLSRSIYGKRMMKHTHIAGAIGLVGLTSLHADEVEITEPTGTLPFLSVKA